MFTLTHTASQAIIQPVAHIGGTRLASRISAALTALKRFFCAKNSAPHYVGLGGTVARLAGALPVRQFHPDRLSIIGVILSRDLNPILKCAIMNTTNPMGKFAQNPQTKTVSQFNVFLHRQLIAQGVSDSLALKIKSRYPATIVKFTGFAGGAL